MVKPKTSPLVYKRKALNILSSDSKWEGYTVHSVVDGGSLNKIQLMCRAGHIVHTNIAKMNKGEQCDNLQCKMKKRTATMMVKTEKQALKFFHSNMDGYEFIRVEHIETTSERANRINIVYKCPNGHENAYPIYRLKSGQRCQKKIVL